jgi:hypothetical protein
MTCESIVLHYACEVNVVDSKKWKSKDLEIKETRAAKLKNHGRTFSAKTNRGKEPHTASVLWVVLN